MSNFSLGRASNYLPGDEVPNLFNWVYAEVAGDLGLVSKAKNTPLVTLTIPAGVWVPVGDTISLDVGSTTATGLMVV